MKEFQLSSTVKWYESVDELPDADRELVAESLKAAENAYAPYSEFHVGSALRLKNGLIVKGNNQENVAYPSGLCAERVALFYTSANYPGEEIEAIAITAQTGNFEITEPITPCGSCRQVLTEAEKNQQKDIRIIMMGEKGTVYICESAKSLLPLMFRADKLKK